jgi:ATP-binding cassette subfamily C protein
LILASSIAGAMLSLTVPIAAGWLYGTILPHNDRWQVPWLFTGLMAVALALAILEYLRGWLFLGLIAHWDRLLHERAFARLLHAKPGYLRHRGGGDWGRRLLGLAEARRALGPSLLNAFFGVAVGIANFAYMALTQPLLAAAAFLLTVALAVVSALLIQRQVHADLAVSQGEGRLAGFVDSAAAHLAALRRTGAQFRAGERQRQMFMALQSAQARSQRAVDTLTAVHAGAALAAPLLLFALAGVVIRRPEPGSFLAFYAAFGQFLFAILGAVTALVSLARAAVPVYRVLPLLEAPQERGGRAPGTQFRGLALERVTFRYEPDAPPALARVDLVLAPGEVVVLTGASGSGKTTALKLILGLEEPQHGLVRINGQPIAHWNPQELRRLAGVALQASPLFPGTVADHITGFRDDPAAREEAKALAALVGLLDAHALLPQGLATVISDPLATPERLRQWIALARAFMGRPPLLLLDEVASGLPPSVRGRVLGYIRETGAACLAITHQRALMAAADRVVLLATGQVAAEGPYQRLVAEEGPFVRFIHGEDQRGSGFGD